MDIQRFLLDGQLAQLPARLGTTTAPVKAALSSPPTPTAQCKAIHECNRYCTILVLASLQRAHSMY